MPTRGAARGDGLRPEWENESAVVLASHPELAIVHVEVRDRSRLDRPLVCYEAVPLRGLRDGRLLVLSLRDPAEKSGGARVRFAKLIIGVATSRAAVPPHVEPLAACLGAVFSPLEANTYRGRLEELALAGYEGTELGDYGYSSTVPSAYSR